MNKEHRTPWLHGLKYFCERITRESIANRVQGKYDPVLAAKLAVLGNAASDVAAYIKSRLEIL